MKYKTGDRVIWGGTGLDAGSKGTVTHVLGKHFEVRWDSDGETYSYEDWAGSSISKAQDKRREDQRRMHYFATGQE